MILEVNIKELKKHEILVVKKKKKEKKKNVLYYLDNMGFWSKSHIIKDF